MHAEDKCSNSAALTESVADKEVNQTSTNSWSRKEEDQCNKLTIRDVPLSSDKDPLENQSNRRLKKLGMIGGKSVQKPFTLYEDNLKKREADKGLNADSQVLSKTPAASSNTDSDLKPDSNVNSGTSGGILFSKAQGSKVHGRIGGKSKNIISNTNDGHGISSMESNMQELDNTSNQLYDKAPNKLADAPSKAKRENSQDRAAQKREELRSQSSVRSKKRRKF